MIEAILRLFLIELGRHRFCYIEQYYSAFTVYYCNKPTPRKFPSMSIAVPLDGKQAEDFFARLRKRGWREYYSEWGPEDHTYFLMRLPRLESGYEYCSLSVQLRDGSPDRNDLFSLDEDNEYLIKVPGMHKLESKLSYLETEGWQQFRVKEYRMYGWFSRFKIRITLYRRPLNR